MNGFEVFDMVHRTIAIVIETLAIYYYLLAKYEYVQLSYQAIQVRKRHISNDPSFDRSSSQLSRMKHLDHEYIAVTIQTMGRTPEHHTF